MWDLPAVMAEVLDGIVPFGRVPVMKTWASGSPEEVFDRLSRAAAHIETICKFARDDHLGYITSCPTNLGTALRASVHIKLPKLMNNKE